jgi:hypothetical protein
MLLADWICGIFTLKECQKDIQLKQRLDATTKNILSIPKKRL